MQIYLRILRARCRRAAFSLVACCALVLNLPSLHAADGATGLVSGTVSNTATGNLLPGAKIEIVSLGLVALTDDTGRFVLSGVPAGTFAPG